MLKEGEEGGVDEYWRRKRREEEEEEEEEKKEEEKKEEEKKEEEKKEKKEKKEEKEEKEEKDVFAENLGKRGEEMFETVKVERRGICHVSVVPSKSICDLPHLPHRTCWARLS